MLHGDDAGKEVTLWLNDENQRNYSEGQRVAQMTSGANLPMKVKVSENEDKTAVYDVFETVEEITQMNKIYLVPSTNPETKNVKDEYITIAVTDQGTTTYSWEQIGTTTVDLSGYYTSQQTDAAISAALNAALASYSTTEQMNTAIATAIANYYTKAQVDALIANFITKSVNDLVNYYLERLGWCL